MFGIFKSKYNLINSGLMKGMTDIHSHVLPGVDDGSPDINTSLSLLRYMESIGLREVWLTPHIMEDIPNTTSYLKERFTELQVAYTGPIALHLAAENMLDNLFEERLKENDLLPLGENNDHLLVETSYFRPPMNLYTIMEHIKTKGYHPVLAHPERYTYMEIADYHRLKEIGVKFQINIPSIVGMYGKLAKKKALLLLNERMITCAGTDTHNYNMLQTCICTSITEKNYRLIDSF